MSSRLISHGDSARRSLLSGIDLVADLVGPTLGPRGLHVVVQRYDAPPLIVNDGVTIARSLELLQDPLRNQGVQLVREAATAADEFLGDGTTTAILLARAIVRESFKRVAQGASPVALRRGIDGAAREACDWIRSQSRAVDGQDDLARVAAVASRSRHVGNLVAEALSQVGADGVIRIEDDRVYGIRLEFREGMRFENGLLAPGLTTDLIRGETVFERPYVLAASERITQVRQLVPILTAITQERASLLIIADEVSGDALALLVLNVSKRRLPAVAVKAPAFGPDRAEALRDIAIFTGGEVFGPGVGRNVDRARVDQLGRAERAIVTREDTTIVGGHGDPAATAARAREIEAETSYLASQYERDKRRIRLARLGGAVALLRVGLDTEAEQEETRYRIHDAVQAGRAALVAGIVPGGGATLLRAASAIRNGDERDDESAGRSVVRIAVEAPLRQLAANANIDPSMAVARVKGSPADHGLDVNTDRLVDLFSAGICDPANVVCSTLEIAVSVAGTCVLTDGMIAHPPIPIRHHRGHGQSHAHSHGHAHEEATVTESRV